MSVFFVMHVSHWSMVDRCVSEKTCHQPECSREVRNSRVVDIYCRKNESNSDMWHVTRTYPVASNGGSLWKPRLSSFWRLCQTCCGRWCRRLLLQPNILKVKRTSETPILWRPLGLNLDFIILYSCAVPLEFYGIPSHNTYDKCKYIFLLVRNT